MSLHTPPLPERHAYLSEQSERASYGIVDDPLSQDSEPVGAVGAVESDSKQDGRSKTSSDGGGGEDAKDREQKGNKPDCKDDEDLPPKLMAIVERFLVSLQEPRYASPLSGDDISGLYQDFYEKFYQAAAAYLKGSGTNTPASIQPMETFSEIAEKKKEREKRPLKIRHYTEMAEALACSRVYSKIFTLSFSGDSDTAANNLIHSRIAVLRQIPVTLVHLDLNEVKEDQLYPLLKGAGSELHKMDESDTPAAKLECLLRAHRVLVATLSSQLAGTSSSADLILPALIYTFIYYDIPNLWLNLQFMNRFRNKRYLQGEHLYCLTNFEAAVGFLNTVTLQVLGIDASEVPENVDTSPLSQTLPSGQKDKDKTDVKTEGGRLGTPGPEKGNRSRSSSSAKRMASILSSSELADQSLKTLGSTIGSIGSSYKYLVGKFSHEKQKTDYPATLEEARKVIGLESRSRSASAAGSVTSIPATNTATSAPSLEVTSEASAMPPPPPPPPPSATTSNSNQLFGKWANFGVIKRLYDDSAPNKDGKIPGPVERYVHCETDQLRMSDIKKLHDDYKRLVKFLRALDAFE